MATHEPSPETTSLEELFRRLLDTSVQTNNVAVGVEQSDEEILQSNEEGQQSKEEEPETDKSSRDTRNVEDAEKIEQNKEVRSQLELAIRELGIVTRDDAGNVVGEFVRPSVGSVVESAVAETLQWTKIRADLGLCSAVFDVVAIAVQNALKQGHARDVLEEEVKEATDSHELTLRITENVMTKGNLLGALATFTRQKSSQSLDSIDLDEVTTRVVTLQSRALHAGSSGDGPSDLYLGTAMQKTETEKTTQTEGRVPE